MRLLFEFSFECRTSTCNGVLTYVKSEIEFCELFQDFLCNHFYNLETNQMLQYTHTAAPKSLRFLKWRIKVRVLITEVKMQGAKCS